MRSLKRRFEADRLSYWRQEAHVEEGAVQHGTFLLLLGDPMAKQNPVKPDPARQTDAPDRPLDQERPEHSSHPPKASPSERPEPAKEPGMDGDVVGR
jgi:hypothetical protein